MLCISRVGMCVCFGCLEQTEFCQIEEEAGWSLIKGVLEMLEKDRLLLKGARKG